MPYFAEWIWLLLPFLKLLVLVYQGLVSLYLALFTRFVRRANLLGLGALVEVPLEHFPFLLAWDLRSKLLHSCLLPRSAPLISLTYKFAFLSHSLSFLLFQNVCIASLRVPEELKHLGHFFVFGFGFLPPILIPEEPPKCFYRDSDYLFDSD